jgi:peptide/nickel transport system substrate-binding protein
LKSDLSRPAMFDFFEAFNMVDKDTMEGPDVKNKEVGTGPWSLAEWQQGDHWTFAKNKNYWQTGRPYLDGFQVNIRQPQTAMTQLESGALDAIRSPGVLDIIRLKNDPNYVNFVHPNPGTFFEIGLSLYTPPLDNKQVRQALSYAINRKYLAEQIYQGLMTVQTLPWSASSPAYEPAKNALYAFDLDKAKSLLDGAGVSNLSVDNWIAAGVFPLLETFLQVYQADLSKIGVKMNILPTAAAEWGAAVNSRKYTGMYETNDNNGNMQPITPFSSGPAWTPNMPNNSGLMDDNWKQIIASISSEIDPAKQKQLYSQMNDYILDQSWNMVLSNNPLSCMTRSALKGVSYTMHGGFDFTNAWLDV